jgi:hypothetical protein
MEKVKPLRPKSQFCLQGILSNEEGLLCSVGCKVNLQILIAVCSWQSLLYDEKFNEKIFSGMVLNKLRYWLQSTFTLKTDRNTK